MRFNFKLATAVAVFLGLGSTQEATRQIAIIGSSPMATSIFSPFTPEMALRTLPNSEQALGQLGRPLRTFCRSSPPRLVST
jgi:hypothetical protein